MLRLAVLFGALVVAVILLSPTIASVSEAVEDLEFRREMPWQIWKWDTEVTPPPPLACDKDPLPTESEVTKWPERIEKDEPFVIGGHVVSVNESRAGVGGILVDLFLNETKEEPGEPLGQAVTDREGRFRLETKVPFDLQARHYHIVAHALPFSAQCKSYREHWSDPEMDVTSETNVTFEAPRMVITGREFNVTGKLVDSVGAPVRDQHVYVSIAGKRDLVKTDRDGRFVWTGVVEEPGDHTITVGFEETTHYGASKLSQDLDVAGEFVDIPRAEGSAGLELDRSRETTVRGTIYLADNQTAGPLNFTFRGLSVRPCAECEPVSAFTVRPKEDGTFETSIAVPSTVEAGRYSFVVSGGGLKERHPFNVTLYVPAILSLEVENAGLLTEAFTGEARIVDDRGKPLPGPLALDGPSGWQTLDVGSDGVATFEAASPCGKQTARAVFNGTKDVRATDAEADVLVCPLALALTPLGIPWWVWAIGIVVLTVLVWSLRSWWATRAPTLTRGPPLELRFVEEDLAPGIAGLGEAVAVEARLESPLPEGHSLRIGRHGAMETVPIGDGLVARHVHVPANLGKLALRAEIVDPKGRAISRRTLFLRVVRYAEEIEARFRALQRMGVGDLADRVSPREFEEWLMERSPNLDPDVARRLVAIFEEADYSPRDVGRRELLGFVSAEQRVSEGVGRPAR